MPTPSDPARKAQIEEVVRTVLAVLEERVAEPSGWRTRLRGGGSWLLKNTASLIALCTLILIAVGLVLRGIDPVTVTDTLVEKYREAENRAQVVDEHVALGNDLLNVGQTDAASDEFNAALKLDASSSTASLGLLKAQLHSAGESGEWDPALYERRLVHLIEAYPNDSQVAAYYGDALLVGGDLNNAVASYDRALELDPNSAIAVNGKANAEDLQNHSESALELYQLAERMSPNTRVFANNVAYQLFRLGRRGEAIERYERILGLDSRFLLAYYILTQAQRLEGALDDAAQTQRTLLGLLAQRRVTQLLPNSGRWFFHTLPPGVQPKPGAASAVFLTTLAEKRCYARLSHGLTEWVAGRRRSAAAEIMRAKRIGLTRTQVGAVLRILRFEGDTLAAKRPQWSARIDQFERNVRRGLRERTLRP